MTEINLDWSRIEGRTFSHGGCPMTTARYLCRTNLDGFNAVEWPKSFATPPRIGECVGGRHANDPKLRPKLRVVSITHYDDHIELELHR